MYDYRQQTVSLSFSFRCLLPVSWVSQMLFCLVMVWNCKWFELCFSHLSLVVYTKTLVEHRRFLDMTEFKDRSQRCCNQTKIDKWSFFFYYVIWVSNGWLGNIDLAYDYIYSIKMKLIHMCNFSTGFYHWSSDLEWGLCFKI